MKKYILTFLCALTLIFQGCDKFLGVEPKGYTIPSTYEDYVKIMNSVSLTKAGSHFPTFITDDSRLTDGNMKANFNSQADNIKYLYSFEHGAIYNDGQTDMNYENGYSRIYYFNVIIDNVMDSKEGTTEEKRQLRAEALLGRAFEYLTLIPIYASAYNEQTAATDYGVPIITKPLDINDMGYRRNTVAEVYKQIMDDLTEALPNLSDKSSNSFRPSKNAGYGFLARMYLQMEKYDLALENAAKSLETISELVDMKLYTIKSPTTLIGRVVLASDMTKIYPEGSDNVENIYTRYPPLTTGNHGAIYGSLDLMELFKSDLPTEAIDMRKALYFSDDLFRNDVFPGYSMWVPFTRMNLGLSTADVILIAAECYTRKGDAASLIEAAKLYNKLRDYRIKNNLHVEFTDKESALVKVLDERRREFALLGSYRLIDLKRLNRDPRFAKTIVHEADGKTWNLAPNDNRYIFPIPPKVKALRPDLPDYQR